MIDFNQDTLVEGLQYGYSRSTSLVGYDHLH